MTCLVETTKQCAIVKAELTLKIVPVTDRVYSRVLFSSSPSGRAAFHGRCIAFHRLQSVRHAVTEGTDSTDAGGKHREPERA